MRRENGEDVMCHKCDEYDMYIGVLKEIVEKHPEFKDKLDPLITFLYGEQDRYVDDVVERDMRE